MKGEGAKNKRRLLPPPSPPRKRRNSNVVVKQTRRKNHRTPRSHHHHHHHVITSKDLSPDFHEQLRAVKSATSTRRNCSPFVRKNRHIIARDNNTNNNNNKTCYPADVLLRLRDAFNAKFPHLRIAATEPAQIHAELAARMRNQCVKEDCWLSLFNKREKKKLQDSLFAPYHPREWLQKPSAWLSNFDINRVMRQYEEAYPHFRFIHSTSIDFDSKSTAHSFSSSSSPSSSSSSSGSSCVSNDMCQFSLERYIAQNVSQIAVVINTAKHTIAGEHWFAIFIDIPERVLFYFDSAPEKTAPKQVRAFLKRVQKQGLAIRPIPVVFQLHDNLQNTHQRGDNECGMYSLYFIVSMMTGANDFSRNMTMDEKLQLFKHTRVDDAYVAMYRKKLFNPPASPDGSS